MDTSILCLDSGWAIHKKVTCFCQVSLKVNGGSLLLGGVRIQGDGGLTPCLVTRTRAELASHFLLPTQREQPAYSTLPMFNLLAAVGPLEWHHQGATAVTD